MRHAVTHPLGLLAAALALGVVLSVALSEEPFELLAARAADGAAAGAGGAGGNAGQGGAGGRVGAAGTGGGAGTGGAGDAVWSEEYVVARMTGEHNAARANVITDAPLPPLTWSPPLASEARRWADELARRCQGIEHRASPAYGQNIASRASTGLQTRFSPGEAVAGWVAEGNCYERGRFGTTDRCDKACVAALHSPGCGHYTQVVWRTTRELGCGYASCDRGGMLVEYWVCNYSPPGNMRGREPY
jgi:pathogenesis-related protein 1